MNKKLIVSLCLLVFAVGSAHAQMDDTATPRGLVDAYGSLADTILAAKQTEWNLVHSILGATYGHAEGVVHRALAKLEAGLCSGVQIP